MSLKMKLTSTICAFLLILGLTIMGVMASPSARVNLGGSISFSATDVNARVTGEVSGYANAVKPELPELLFSGGLGEDEQAELEDKIDEWGNCDLEFNSTGTGLSIVVTIENLAQRTLYATVNPSLTMSTAVISTMELLDSASDASGEEYIGDIIELGNYGSETDTAYVRLNLEIRNKNTSLPEEATWGYDIVLNDEAGILTTEEWANKEDGTALLFELFNGEDQLTLSEGEKYTASVRGMSDYNEEGDYYENYTNSGAITIPSQVKGEDGKIYTVTEIADKAFGDYDMDYSAQGITSVSLPGTIKTIGVSAFYLCEYLECNLILPSGVETIGEYAFCDTGFTGDLVIPSSVKEIGETSFSGCDIDSLILENGVDIMGGFVFSECLNLQTVFIGGGVVGEDAFSYCNSLINVTLSEGVKTIGEGAFGFCESLENLVLSEGLETIGDSAFSGCENLTCQLVLPNGLKTIGPDAFNTTGISGELIIPESVTSIGDNAFCSCESLTSVTILGSTTEIDNGAFSECTNLKMVRMKSTTPPTLGSDVFPTNVNVIVVPDGTREDYIEADGWVDYEPIIFEESVYERMLEEGILTVAQWKAKTDGTALEFELDEENLTASAKGVRIYNEEEGYYEEWTNYGAITIPAHVAYSCEIYTVTAIADLAFGDAHDWNEGAHNITSISLPDTIKSIGVEAFWGCDGLEGALIIPSSVTTIGGIAFAGCNSLERVVIGDGVKKIGYEAFFSCGKLTSITIPSSVKEIIGNPFSYCTSLETIKVAEGNTVYEDRGLNAIVEIDTNTLISGCKNTTINDSIEIIGDYAFSHCSGLKSITIPDSVTTIGIEAFGGCENLESVVLSNKVETIGDYAFSYCSGLKSVTIPDSVTSIGERAFSGCSGLKSVTIPDSVTEIGERAFFSCDNLTSVVIGNKVETIETSAFEYCRSLTTITIPASVTSIGKSAFWGCKALTTVNYRGTEEQWNAIVIDNTNSENQKLIDANKVYNYQG